MFRFDNEDEIFQPGGSFFFTPFVLFSDLFLLAGGEIILDVECLTDILRSLSLYHVGHSLASDVQQTLNKRVDSMKRFTATPGIRLKVVYY